MWREVNTNNTDVYRSKYWQFGVDEIINAQFHCGKNDPRQNFEKYLEARPMKRSYLMRRHGNQWSRRLE